MDYNYEEEFNRLLVNEYRILRSPSGTEFTAQKRKRRYIYSFFYCLLFCGSEDIIIPRNVRYKWVDLSVSMSIYVNTAIRLINNDIKKRLDRDRHNWVEMDLNSLFKD